jgi:hypothetical protein
MCSVFPVRGKKYLRYEKNRFFMHNPTANPFLPRTTHTKPLLTSSAHTRPHSREAPPPCIGRALPRSTAALHRSTGGKRHGSSRLQTAPSTDGDGGGSTGGAEAAAGEGGAQPRLHLRDPVLQRREISLALDSRAVAANPKEGPTWSRMVASGRGRAGAGWTG